MILGRNQDIGSDRDIIECEVNMEKREDAGGKHVVGWKLAARSQENKE
jgi:hypothetical protein